MCADWHDEEASCSCGAAVLRAYDGVRNCGEPHPSAAQAAARVFRWHHPEMSRVERTCILSEWLDRLDVS